MFTEKLFDHRYDIDDILIALCGDNHKGRWLLHTRKGEMFAEQENDATKQISQGDDNNHWYTIEPLPISFLSELKTHRKLKRLNEEDKNAVLSILETCTALHQLPPQFTQGAAGGWLRDQVKEAAMEWLDMNSLVPPSMRHVRDVSQFAAPVQNLQVQIELDENMKSE